MVESTFILLVLCATAVLMVAAAGIYYRVNRGKLDD
jgi:hypothetical protein